MALVRDFDLKWDYNDPAATERVFRSMLGGAPDEAYRQELMTQIARTLGLQRRFEEAASLLSEIQPLNDRVAVRQLLERGRVLNSSGEKAQAMPLFVEAMERASAAGEEFFAVDAAHMVGIAAPIEEQLRWNEKAVAIAEAATDERAKGWLGSLYNNIGWTHHEAGRYESAMDAFRKALECRERSGEVEKVLVARWCVARCLRSLGRVEEALRIQEELFEEHSKTGSSDGYVNEEIAECLLALGRTADASPYFRSAYLELSKDQWLAAESPERLERMKELAAI